MSVLILEDNRQILKVLEKLVLSVAEDEKVYVTDNVGEAYKIAMEISIDVFMLDIILYGDKKGDTSGMQYAQSMRKLERYRFTPIIFITSLYLFAPIPADIINIEFGPFVKVCMEYAKDFFSLTSKNNLELELPPNIDAYIGSTYLLSNSVKSNILHTIDNLDCFKFGILLVISFTLSHLS